MLYMEAVCRGDFCGTPRAYTTIGIMSYCLVGRNFEKWTDLEFLQQPQ